MSVIVRIGVICDATDCDTTVVGGLRTRTEAIRLARLSGWSVSERGTFCPDHRRPLSTHVFMPDRDAWFAVCTICGHSKQVAAHGRA